jgi:hypothetical protein
MMDSKRRSALCVLIASCLGACVSPGPLLPAPSAPFFMPTLEDTARLAKFSHELDSKALQCVEAANCEKVYFSRGVVSLFENKEAARASFGYVIEHNATSPLATTSKLWLRLIDDEESVVAAQGGSHPSSEIMRQFVRDWVEGQLSDAPTGLKPITVTPMPNEVTEQSRVAYGMQRQVRERDRQIAELRAQLEALKLIDQDHQTHRKVRPPASLKAAEHSPH